MAIRNFQRSVPEIVSDVFLQFTTLVRKEAQLARTEMSDNVASVARALGMVVGGAVLLIPALVILLQAAVAELSELYAMRSSLSSLAVGGVVLIVGIILLSVGMSRLKIENIMPNRTVQQLRRDASVAKEQVSQDHEERRAA